MLANSMFIAVNGPCRVSQSEKIELIVIYYFKHICFWMNYVSNSVMFVPIDQTSCWTHQGYHEDPHTYFPVAWIFPKRYVCMFFEQYFVLIQLYRYQSLLCRKEQHRCCYCTLGPNHSGRTFSFAFLENLRSYDHTYCFLLKTGS